MLVAAEQTEQTRGKGSGKGERLTTGFPVSSHVPGHFGEAIRAIGPRFGLGW